MAEYQKQVEDALKRLGISEYQRDALQKENAELKEQLADTQRLLSQAQKTIKIQSATISNAKNPPPANFDPQHRPRRGQAGGPLSAAAPSFDPSAGGADQYSTENTNQDDEEGRGRPRHRVQYASQHQSLAPAPPTTISRQPSNAQPTNAAAHGAMVLVGETSDGFDLGAKYQNLFGTVEKYTRQHIIAPNQVGDQHLPKPMITKLQSFADTKVVWPLISSNETRCLVIAKLINEFIVGEVFGLAVLRGFKDEFDTRFIAIRKQLPLGKPTVLQSDLAFFLIVW